AKRLAAVLALGAFFLVPVWAFPLFPSQDGPSHVANSWILRSLLTGGDAALAGVYRVNLQPFPNWMSHASLAVLLTFLGPVAAEKVLLTLFLIALPASFRYALDALRPGSRALVALVVPFAYDSSLHLGYYNRAFAAVPFLLCLGFWTRREGRLGIRGTAGLAALLTWLYFCAAVSLVLAVVGLGILLAHVTLEEQVRKVPDRGRALARRGLALAAASLPALLLLVRFQARESGGVVGPGPGPLERLRSLAALDFLVSLDARERWLCSALAASLAVAFATFLVARARKGGWARSDALLVLGALAAAGYLLAPAVGMAGHGPWGGTVHERIAPHVWLVLLLWLGAQPLGTGIRRALVASAIGIGVGLVGLRLPRYAELNDHLREYLSVAPWVPARALVLPLSYAHHGRREDGSALAHGTWPFRHAADWLVPARGVVNADNYEAEVSFFPVTHRTGYDPYRLLGSSLDRMPACVRLARFNRLAPRPAEVVLVWGARWEERDDSCTEEVRRTLETQYRRVFVSTPRGQAEVYRHVPP
ncbi:MAG TPA: hypothetical protein VIC87_13085, partial [Vicinamibacteria bacterium]